MSDNDPHFDDVGDREGKQWGRQKADRFTARKLEAAAPEEVQHEQRNGASITLLCPTTKPFVGEEDTWSFVLPSEREVPL